MCLYVNDLIITDNNLEMIAEFKSAMISHFEMTDLGLMSYLLSIKVTQSDDGIFVC